MNDIPMGKGYATIDYTINPGETKEVPVLQNFKKTRFSPAVESVVNSGGIINLHVNGTAFFKLLGMNIPVPFESSKQISIIDEIKNRLTSEIGKKQ